MEIFGICDTNSDPSVLDYVIPANDDGPKSLVMVLGLVEQALAAGLVVRGKEVAKEAADKAAAEAQEQGPVVSEKLAEVIEEIANVEEGE